MDLTKRQLIAGALAAALPRSALAAPGPIALPNDLGLADYTTITAVSTTAPDLALTFDDGPHPTLTPRLLDMLSERGLKATFFLIGNRVATWPRIAARIAEEGHEIGNHSWSHPHLDKFSDAAVIDEIDRTSVAIFNATGRAPVTFRPPYGAFTARQRVMLHDARGMPSVLWSVDPQDWAQPGAQIVARRILNAARPGAIVLSHDIKPGTVTAMPQVLDGLELRGYQPRTVSTLIGWPNWSDRDFASR